jgi:hypothetical protein
MTQPPVFHIYLYGQSGGPLGTRFDEVCRRLMQLQRLYLEPDGSLLLTGELWQVGGMLYDRHGVLQYAELQGSCPLPQWQALVARIGWPDELAPSVADTNVARLSVLRLSDQTLHDLQTFERITWSASAAGPSQS